MNDLRLLKILTMWCALIEITVRRIIKVLVLLQVAL